MEQVKKSLEQAYTILSTIPVSGDNVDKMTAVRAELRRAFSLLKEQEVKNG